MYPSTPTQTNGIKINYPEGTKVNPLASIGAYPANFYIEGLNDNERVLLFIRESKVILFLNTLYLTLISLLPVLAQFLFTLFDRELLGSFLNIEMFFNSKYWLAILALWVSFILRGYYNIFFHWYYNINILTNNRFLDIEIKSLFQNRVEETSVLDIQDAKDTQSGLFQSVCNIGDLQVYTASGETSFDIANIPRSSIVRDFIMDVAIAERKRLKSENG